MKTEVDFGDLSDDKAIQTKLLNFRGSVDKISKIVELCSNSVLYEKLNTKDKVDFDLFMAYTLNTLFWLYMKTKGEDPNKSEIKNQLNRVKQYMVKAKEANDRKSRPKPDGAAIARFIKHGINYKEDREVSEPPNKKIKFSD